MREALVQTYPAAPILARPSAPRPTRSGVGASHPARTLSVVIVEQIRRRSPAGDTTVAVFTEHFFDDALRRRVREAGADFFWDRCHLRDARTLVAAVLDPRKPPGVPRELDPENLFRLGVTEVTRVNRAVE